MSTTHHISMVTAASVLILMVSSGGHRVAANERPVADAGLPRYAAASPVQLDGTRSYDPDGSGLLSFAWRQTSGPPLRISQANTATPSIRGFVQTDAIQECEFELVVSDGDLTSAPDTVKVIIVPDFGAITLQQQNPPFDPNKPTVFYFSGGDCVNGFVNEQSWGNATWFEKANIINFPQGYAPDTSGPDPWRTYYHMGDMIIVFLSQVAPNYEQPIQTIGWSTGGQPAMDAGIRLNRVYKDSRYAVNHVTELDAPCRWQFQGVDVYLSSNALFLTSAVDGEPCLHDHYWGVAYPMQGDAPQDLLGVWLDGYNHAGVRDWYRDSLTTDSANQFNHGVVAGAYWSVVGPGKNLQLASTPGAQTYTFKWTGSATNRQMEFYDESNYPGRLPEPVTLVGPSDGAAVGADGAILSCRNGENAVRYQLLFGRDPFHMIYLVADGLTPPSNLVTVFPFQKTWWTMKAHDQYGSTIYADPVCISAENVVPQTIQNSITGQTYVSIQQAINDAHDGDEIVIGAGVCQYLGNLDLQGKCLTLRSADPNDPRVVGATILAGDGRGPVVTLSSGEGKPPTLDGLTITGGTVGISCCDAVPTIRNCVVECPDGIAVEFWWGRKPVLIACTLVGQVKEGGDPGLIAYWRLDEASGAVASDGVETYDGTLVGDPVWQPTGGKVGGALQFDGSNDYVTTPFVWNPTQGPFNVFAWVKGGTPGQVILSQAGGANWLTTRTSDGALMTDLKSFGRQGKSLTSTTVVTDGVWHRVGLIWDGSNRILYVDDIEVARDTQANLPSSPGGLYIGAGSKLAAGTFWSGLIDDVRIYNRVVQP